LQPACRCVARLLHFALRHIQQHPQHDRATTQLRLRDLRFRMDDRAVGTDRAEAQRGVSAQAACALDHVTHTYALALLDDRREASTRKLTGRVTEDLVEAIVGVGEAAVAYGEHAGEGLVEKEDRKS